MTVTVVSASYGGYDQPDVPPEQDTDVRWVMVTDGKCGVPDPWERSVEPRAHLHPRMAAKVPKCLPWQYADTEIVIWLDASAMVLRADFVSSCVQALGSGDVAQWVHPQRDCVMPEADVSSTMAKYASQPVREQAYHYIAAGHPRNGGLWATGCTVWRCGWATKAAGAEWLQEQVLWTYQDQLSWPVIVRKHALDVRPLPGSLWDRRHLVFRAHASEQ